jgi:2-dehydropantoate 2-reductase
VVGLGGVGGYISAMFAKSGIAVVGFARGNHLKQIKQNGIKIVEDDCEWNVNLDARELSDADGYFDVVLFCVKSYDLIESYNMIKKCVDKNSVLFSLSNGVSNGDMLRDISNSCVLDACAYILSHIQSAGVIRKKGQVFAVVFGGDDEEGMSKVSYLFEKASLRYKTPKDIKSAIWKKYIFISAFATLTSYYDKSIGYIYEHYFDEAKELLQEIANFAKSKGVNIDDEVQKSLDTASKVPYDSSTSMHLDFNNNKRVELESLSAYVKTPLMQKLYKELLKRV